MKGKRNRSGGNIIDLIYHIESDLSKLKEALLDDTYRGNKKKASQSVRKSEFCGMWKDRKDMKGLSSAEWLARLRREQWGKTQ